MFSKLLVFATVGLVAAQDAAIFQLKNDAESTLEDVAVLEARVATIEGRWSAVVAFSFCPFILTKSRNFYLLPFRAGGLIKSSGIKGNLTAVGREHKWPGSVHTAQYTRGGVAGPFPSRLSTP
jgi:hypothetical protein